MTTYTYNLAQSFARVVNANPEAIALRIPDKQQVTFQQLHEQSTQIAHWLTSRGVQKEHVVAIVHDKSAAAFASMLACLKMGVIYVNLDPDSPWERLRKILKTCRPALVLIFSEGRHHTDTMLSEGLVVGDCESDTIKTEIDAASVEDLTKATKICSSDPAYVMFTSGSTGTPKGAVISHGNLMNFIAWAQAEYHINSNDVLTNVNPMFFDNSVFDFYVSLFCGATLLPVTRQQVSDSRELIRIVNKHRATIWFSVPSLLIYLLTTRALSQDHFPAMRKMIFGGEGFPKAKLRQLFNMFSHRLDLHNVYGPTECTCICSSHWVNTGDFADMQSLTTLGKIAPNFDYQIQPTHDDPNTGELLLHGPQVGHGYFGKPDQTIAKFVQNPNHNRYRDICYRTGDLVQRDTRGNLHFKGRIDFQIKHLGYRIELEEIEAAIATLEGIDECAVTYKTLPGGFGQIEAFVASATECSTDIVVELSRILPAYMIPKRVHWLHVLPRNANGKIDRSQLEQFTKSLGRYGLEGNTHRSQNTVLRGHKSA